MRPKPRPAFKTAAMEAYELAQLDARLSRQDAERRQQLDAQIAADMASRTPEQTQAAEDHLARLYVVASDESIRREERLAQRRNANTDTFGT
jgi:predicted nucleotide-binding protein